jgi:hypothetical protein
MAVALPLGLAAHSVRVAAAAQFAPANALTVKLLDPIDNRKAAGVNGEDPAVVPSSAAPEPAA